MRYTVNKYCIQMTISIPSSVSQFQSANDSDSGSSHFFFFFLWLTNRAKKHSAHTQAQH